MDFAGKFDLKPRDALISQGYFDPTTKHSFATNLADFWTQEAQHLDCLPSHKVFFQYLAHFFGEEEESACERLAVNFRILVTMPMSENLGREHHLEQIHVEMSARQREEKVQEIINEAYNEIALQLSKFCASYIREGRMVEQATSGIKKEEAFPSEGDFIVQALSDDDNIKDSNSFLPTLCKFCSSFLDKEISLSFSRPFRRLHNFYFNLIHFLLNEDINDEENIHDVNVEILASIPSEIDDPTLLQDYKSEFQDILNTSCEETRSKLRMWLPEKRI